jgi:hypothetical protein
MESSAAGSGCSKPSANRRRAGREVVVFMSGKGKGERGREKEERWSRASAGSVWPRA